MALIEYLQNSIYMNLIYEDRYQLILSGLWVTLLLTVVSFVLGTVLGMAFCAGKGSRNRVVRTVCRLFTQLMVKLPPLVLLMIFAYLIFVNSSLTPVAIAVVTFTLKCASHLAEMFRTAVDSVSPGEVEAALREALGERFGLDDRQTRPKVTTLYAQALERAFPELYTHVTPLVSREEAETAADEIKKQKAARGERKSEKPEKPAEGGEQPAARRRRKSEQE